jgi:HEAT repeat protein
MRWGRALTVAALAASVLAADADLEAALAKVARYNYDQGRDALLELEKRMRALPAADVEKRFVEFLRSDASLAGKDQICRQLSLIGGEASAPVLASMLASPDTVEMARYALERIPAPDAAAALRNALESAPAKARPGIANSLGVKRDAAAVPALARLASAADPLLAESSASALGRIATPQAMAALAALRKKNVTAAMEASLVAADSLKLSGDGDGALAVYRELSAATAPVLIRIGALEGLTATLNREALPQLAPLIEDADPRLQAAAIRLINIIPGREVTTLLQSRLAKIAPAGRARLVMALAERGDRAALPAIVASVRDADEGVRTAAMAGLAIVGDPASVALLAEVAASDASTDADRAAARAALDQMRGEAADRAIVAALRPASGKAKLELIRPAGERGIAAAAPALIEAAQSGDPTVKREAVRALRETAGASQVADLIALLSGASSESERREIERALAAALRRSPAAKSADVVAAYTSAPSRDAKASLLQVMGQSGVPETLVPLRAGLSDADPELVRAAILALAEWPGDAPLADLVAFSGRANNPAHQVLAQRAILRLVDLPSRRTADESVKILGTVVAQASPAEKRAALALLARFGTQEALAVAEAAAADPAVAAEAKAAAQRIRRNLQGC